MKKLFALLATFAPVAMFAQEASPTFDLSAAGTAATTISTSLSNLLTGQVLTAALVVLSGLVTLWVIFKIPKWVGAGHK